MPTPQQSPSTHKTLSVRDTSSPSNSSLIKQLKNDLKSKQHQHNHSQQEQHKHKQITKKQKLDKDNKSSNTKNSDDVDDVDMDDDDVQEANDAQIQLVHKQPIIRDFFKKSNSERTTSFLRPFSSFVGSQESGRATYEVKVDLKEVDLSRSHLCGFLTIHGLTDSHPEITTFFKGEIIGPHYSFYTDHEMWGSTKGDDLQHWGRFPSWRNLDFDPDFDFANDHIYQNAYNNEYLYMRWKELFLVPDAKIKDIRGASFAGFYYVCFNQYRGSISGLYFHRCSDRFQKLELAHIPDGGITPTYSYA
ncbi:unnamed protein product [Ambrosiozyma monospora]|uniref:Unnamed protein product n=1 Tax=Ambrosiozyma monospora TaxID=43982 RepID=A0ACB5T4G8_AMBMO|nr:unnamed protein product [Ambrosiozyma monospora]